MASFDAIDIRNADNKKVAELKPNSSQQLADEADGARFFGELSLWRPDIKTALVRASALTGSLILGAKKKVSGRITLYSKEGGSTVALTASDGDLSISAGTVRMSKLQSLRARFRELVLTDNRSNVRVRFDARRGRLELMNASGDVTMTLESQSGDILLSNADCAEEFDVAPDAEEVGPGAVVVLAPDGLRACRRDADRAVAGVVSGAGYRPALVLDRQADTSTHRVPVALMGKVHCRVDANLGRVDAGMTLTTSTTTGHARAVRSGEKATGAVLGKALSGLADGRGLVPMLVWPH